MLLQSNQLNIFIKSGINLNGSVYTARLFLFMFIGLFYVKSQVKQSSLYSKVFWLSWQFYIIFLVLRKIHRSKKYIFYYYPIYPVVGKIQIQIFLQKHQIGMKNVFSKPYIIYNTIILGRFFYTYLILNSLQGYLFTILNQIFLSSIGNINIHTYIIEQ